MKSIEKVDRPSVRAKIKSTIAVFEKTFPNKGISVVDIGTRVGYAVKLLNKAGYSAIGTDVEPFYVDHAVSKGRNVIVDDVMDTRLRKGTFDVVFSRHVLEHCGDTVQFLNSCKALLKNGGHVFCTFPLESREKFKEKYNKATGLTSAGHKVYYETIDNFRAVLGMVDFEIKYLDYSEKLGIIPMKKEVLLIGRVTK